jgi:hypothetical protein
MRRISSSSRSSEAPIDAAFDVGVSRAVAFETERRLVLEVIEKKKYVLDPSSADLARRHVGKSAIAMIVFPPQRLPIVRRNRIERCQRSPRRR